MAAQSARMLSKSSQVLSVVLAGEFKTPRDNIVKKLEAFGVSSPSKLTKKSVLCLADVQRPNSTWQSEARLRGVPVVNESFIQQIMHAPKPDAIDWDDLLSKCVLALPDLQEDAVESNVSSAVNAARKKRKNVVSSPLMSDMSPQKRRKMSTSSSGSADSDSGKQSHVIALEGLIGIGKSTLCNKLIDNFPNDVDVYKEQTNEKFLQLFYSDTKRYGFALQWGMLKSRIYQLRLAQHDAQHGRVPSRKYFYWDRSMIGDYTFALWNHLLGGISKQEMEVYESEFGGSVRALDKIEFMNDIDLFVFMDDEPQRCKDRVEHLRKNPSEQGIPIEYYNGLDDIHFHIFVEMMIKKVSKVVVVTWGEYDNPVSTQDLFQSIIQGKKRSPSVGRVDISEISDPSPNSLVYETESDLMTFYGLIRNQSPDLALRKSYENVYIPSNVMTISYEQKGIIPDHDYDITFYQNEYKRVVMWHLANFQNVYFYNTPTL